MLDVLRRVARHRSGLVGGVLVLVFVLVGAAGPVARAVRSDQGRPRAHAGGPSREHWLGTDELGRDVLSRIIWGARLTLRVGLIAVAIGVLVGVPLGLVSGYVGGTFDLLAQRLVDVLLAFPGVLLAIMIVAIMGTGLENVMIAVGVVSIPTYTRLVRGQVLALMSLPFSRRRGRSARASSGSCSSTCCRTRCRRSSCSRRSSSPRPSSGPPG